MATRLAALDDVDRRPDLPAPLLVTVPAEPPAAAGLGRDASLPGTVTGVVVVVVVIAVVDIVVVVVVIVVVGGGGCGGVADEVQAVMARRWTVCG